MSDILDQLNEAALFATNRACTFDGQPDEAGMRDLGYAYGHLHREAFTEIERLRGLLQNLADAADDVGIRHFDTDSMPGSVRRMQDATLAARAALGAADQPAVVPHRCSMELTGLQIQHLHDFCGGDFDCSITVEYFDAAPDDEDGNPMPAGLWAYFTDYPDEGRTFLPATADKPADQPAAQPHYGDVHFADHKQLERAADQPAAVRVVFTMRECTACGAQWDYDRADCPRCARAASSADEVQR